MLCCYFVATFKPQTYLSHIFSEKSPINMETNAHFEVIRVVHGNKDQKKLLKEIASFDN